MKPYCSHEAVLFPWSRTIPMKSYYSHEVLLFPWSRANSTTSQISVFFVMTSRPYPLYVHRTIKVDSILYQKFALWTYSPFRHVEMSRLYLSWNNILRALPYVCRHCNIKFFNLNKHFFFSFFSIPMKSYYSHEVVLFSWSLTIPMKSYYSHEAVLFPWSRTLPMNSNYSHEAALFWAHPIMSVMLLAFVLSPFSIAKLTIVTFILTLDECPGGPFILDDRHRVWYCELTFIPFLLWMNKFSFIFSTTHFICKVEVAVVKSYFVTFLIGDI